MCVSPIRKEFLNFVFHHRPATRLKDNDWGLRVEDRAKYLHKFQQVFFRRVEKAVVVQRAATAHITVRQNYVVAKMLEHLDRCFCSLREEVVVECVGKKQNALTF